MASCMHAAQWAGLTSRQVSQGDSRIPVTLSLDIFIMFPFCDAFLIELKCKLSKDINRCICPQVGWVPDPSTGHVGFNPTTLQAGGWAS